MARKYEWDATLQAYRPVYRVRLRWSALVVLALVATMIAAGVGHWLGGGCMDLSWYCGE